MNTFFISNWVASSESPIRQKKEAQLRLNVPLVIAEIMKKLTKTQIVSKANQLEAQPKNGVAY